MPIKLSSRPRGATVGTPLALLATTVLAWGCASTSEQGIACAAPEQATGRLFLQQVTATSAIIKWRGEADFVCLGTSHQDLARQVHASEQGSHKIAAVTGLNPDTTYYYAVGGGKTEGQPRQFRTA